MRSVCARLLRRPPGTTKLSHVQEPSAPTRPWCQGGSCSYNLRIARDPADQTGQGPADFWDAVMRDLPLREMTEVMSLDHHTPPLCLLIYGVGGECSSVQFSSVHKV